MANSRTSAYPFRLGTTSYIIPDNIIPNAKYLADKVDDIQLILFESDDISLPNSEDISILQEIAGAHSLTYSIHFPLDTILGASEPLRETSTERHIDIIKTTLPLDPSAYIVHFNGDPGQNPSEDMPRWLENSRMSIEEILDATNADPRLFCAETLSYPLELIDDIINEYDLSVCLDIGHLIVNGFSVEDHLDRYLDRTRSIHLHGTSGKDDHLDLSYLPHDTLDFILSRIEGRDLNLTVEVFNEQDFLVSMEVLQRYYNKA